MLRRHDSDSMAPGPEVLRSALSNAALVVEERAWVAADAFRAAAEVVRWPFERAAWTLERVLVWPLGDRAVEWSAPVRGGALAIAVAIAAASAALGISLGASGAGNPTSTRAASNLPTGLPTSGATEASTRPVLQGAAPVFAPKEEASTEAAAAVEPVSGGSDTAAAQTEKAVAVPAGPAAMRVARRFSEAFVLYEIGEESSRAKEIFRQTATPKLAGDLADRPPQLPANAIVPKAKVLNIVPGPRHGRTYTVSVSLLRVGVASELRLDLKRTEDGWSVANVRG